MLGTIVLECQVDAFHFLPAVDPLGFDMLMGATGPNRKQSAPTLISMTFSNAAKRRIMIDKAKDNLTEKLKEIRSKTVQVIDGKVSSKQVVNEHVDGNETLASDYSNANEDSENEDDGPILLYYS